MRGRHHFMLERLEQARKAKNLSRRQLALLAGVEPVTLAKLVGRLKSGEGYGTLDTWLRLSVALGKSMDHLTCRDISDRVPLDGPVDEYPARARAVAAAWLLGLPEDAIKSVYQVPGATNLPERWWFDLILARTK